LKAPIQVLSPYSMLVWVVANKLLPVPHETNELITKKLFLCLMQRGEEKTFIFSP